MAILSVEDATAILNLSCDDTLLPLLVNGAEKLCKNFMGWDPERSAQTEYYPVSERGGGYDHFVENWGSHLSTGGRTRILQLKRGFVLASGLVVEEYSGAYMGQNDDVSWETLTLGGSYILDLDDDNLSESGHLRRLGSYWPRSRGSVKVTYTAGFTSTELSGSMGGSTDYTDASDIRLAVMLMVQKMYNEMKPQQSSSSGSGAGVAGPLTSEKVPDYSYTRDATSSRALTGMMLDLPPEIKQILNRYTKRYAFAI